LAFLDETGININKTRNSGYSPKNMKAYKIVKRSTNIILYQSRNLVFFLLKLRTVYLKAKVLCSSLLVMDYCSFHHRKDVISLMVENNINYRFYLRIPFIEEYFSNFKDDLASFRSNDGEVHSQFKRKRLKFG